MATAACLVSWTAHGHLQVPALNIFKTSLERGKFDESRKLSDGSLMTFSHIYPMDAVFDTMADVPEEVRGLRREAQAGPQASSQQAWGRKHRGSRRPPRQRQAVADGAAHAKGCMGWPPKPQPCARAVRAV